MENKNFLNIKNKLDLIKKVEFMTSLGIYQTNGKCADGKLCLWK